MVILDMINIEKLERISDRQKEIKNRFDYNREVLIHLENGTTATSTLGTVVIDYRKRKVLCRYEDSIVWVDFEDIHNAICF